MSPRKEENTVFLFLKLSVVKVTRRFTEPTTNKNKIEVYFLGLIIQGHRAHLVRLPTTQYVAKSVWPSPLNF